VDTNGTPTPSVGGKKPPTRARLSPSGAGLRPALQEPSPMRRMPPSNASGRTSVGPGLYPGREERAPRRRDDLAGDVAGPGPHLRRPRGTPVPGVLPAGWTPRRS
jgi:hypothetical protein